MREFDYVITSDASEILNKVLSSLLPHENFNGDEASEVLEELFRVLPQSEVYGCHYVFYNILSNLKILKLYRKNVHTALNRGVFEEAVISSAARIINSQGFKLEQFYQLIDQSPPNLHVSSEFEAAMADVADYSLQLYDECFDLAIPTGEGLVQLQLLQEVVRDDLIAQIINLQGIIYNDGYMCKTRFYRGSEDAALFAGEAYHEVDLRMMSTHEKHKRRFVPTTFKTYEEAVKFEETQQNSIRELFTFGWEPIDEMFIPSSADIIAFIAPEGTGKTRLNVYLTLRALMAGNNVCVMCGETTEIKFKHMLECAYIFIHSGQKYQPGPKDLINPEIYVGDHPEDLEEFALEIKSARMELYGSKKFGKLTTVPTICYEESYDFMEGLVVTQDINMFVIDHVKSLTNNGAWVNGRKLRDVKQSIDYLLDQEIALAQDYGVAFINFSHPSVDAQNAIEKGKDPGVRAGGMTANTTQSASFVGVLSNDDTLKAHDKVMLRITKVREDKKTASLIVLSRVGFSNMHIYDPADQYLAQDTQTNPVDLEALLGEDEDYDSDGTNEEY